MRNKVQIPAVELPGKIELMLHLADGTPWTLSVSPGCERFIGRYARLPGINPGGALLTFRSTPARA